MWGGGWGGGTLLKYFLKSCWQAADGEWVEGPAGVYITKVGGLCYCGPRIVSRYVSDGEQDHPHPPHCQHSKQSNKPTGVTLTHHSHQSSAKPDKSTLSVQPVTEFADLLAAIVFL